MTDRDDGPISDDEVCLLADDHDVLGDGIVQFARALLRHEGERLIQAIPALADFADDDVKECIRRMLGVEETKP